MDASEPARGAVVGCVRHAGRGRQHGQGSAPALRRASRRAGPTSSRAWPRCTAGARPPGRSPSAGCVPVIIVDDGPASQPRAAARRRPLVVMTAAYCTRSSRGRRWWPSSRAWPSTTTSSAGQPHTPAGPGRGDARRPRREVRRAGRPRAAGVPALAHRRREPPRWPSVDPPDRLTPEAGELLPTTTTGSYKDVRDVMAAIVDDGIVLELRGRWAPNLVTAFATIDGRPVGILANQPLAIAGTLDIPASQKGARFVSFCDAFNLPIITLVDTPGFYPGKDLESAARPSATARSSSSRTRRATVARICVILRKSYGGAYIVMDSKRMGNDVCLRVAGRGAGGSSGRGAGRRHPAAPGHAGGAGRVRGRLLGPPPQPLRGGRAGLRGHGDRAERDPAGDQPGPAHARPPSGRTCDLASTTTRRCSPAS